MNSPSQTSSTRGFTLIELLTVIAIIAILLAILLPHLTGAKDQAKKAEAETACKGIVAAVLQYKTEYGRLPDATDPNAPGAAGGGAASDTSVGDAAAGIAGNPNSLLMNTLRAIGAGGDPTLPNPDNPRGIRFIDLKRAGNQAQPKSGTMDSATEGEAAFLGCYFDPWGKQYNVVIDSSGDQRIDITKYYADFPSTDLPMVEVGAFSLGKDRKLGDNGKGRLKEDGVRTDDAVSWQ